MAGMQTTPDGEYIPSKELNRSFKIPKKRTTPQAETPSASQKVMEDSYYNYVAETPIAMIPPQQIDAARKLILHSLQKQKYEKPKTYQNQILRDTIPDCFDETLPKELTSHFQPLYCKLCSAQLSSNIVAKLHYKSKNHEKKIRKFLIEHSERTGEPLHKRAKVMPKTNEVELEGCSSSNPLYFYCDVCDLPLTGKLHAESHYMGKNHRKATLGVKAPAGKGHYDASGKWIREGPSQKKPGTNADDNDFGIGRDFRPVSTDIVAGFRCDLCNITTTCQEQLNNHFMGQKHRKKLKQQGIDAAGLNMIQSPESGCSPLPSDFVDKLDCSVYRTPSGNYYCQICNTSSNSEVQFKQHLQSKNHISKATQKKT